MLTIDYRYFSIKDNDIVVDIGCGEGRHIIDASIRNFILAIGVDLSKKDLSSAQQKMQDCAVFQPKSHARFQQADATRLPFDDNSIDKIICSEVLEHIPNYQAVISEIQRVLKPQGILAISVPRYWPEKICWWLSSAYHQVEGGHIRIFKKSALKKEIIEKGFDHHKTHYAHALHSPYWWLRCLFWQTQETNFIIKRFHEFLVWDLMQKPWITRLLDRCLNPLMGKSVVMYFRKSI